MDVLMSPVVFKEPASRAAGRCATTGAPTSPTVTPDGLRDLAPAACTAQEARGIGKRLAGLF
ncbi:hypothetical protein AB0D66_14070 [Streptomyces sp. NPDC048270]|uniref:hypothetical protein n=1 Tax=Streptomyces sp. NPDC048270 TaxID=3154615 RepID=UPI0033F69FBE